MVLLPFYTGSVLQCSLQSHDKCYMYEYKNNTQHIKTHRKRNVYTHTNTHIHSTNKHIVIMARKRVTATQRQGEKGPRTPKQQTTSEETKATPPKEAKPEVPSLPPVGFGEADDPPYLVEVKVSVEAPSGDSAGCTGAVSDANDGEVVCVGGTGCPVAQFPHARKDCTKHSFAFETRKSILQSTKPYKKNDICCDKCFCYVCDVPASECKFWCNTAAGQPAHCNAFASKRTDFWDIQRCMHRNPLVRFLAQQRPTHLSKKLYEQWETVRGRVDRAWRQYEAGDVVTKHCIDKDKKTSVLHHKFSHVTSWFQHFFHSTRITITEKEWIQKFIRLDALTEVMVKRSWRPPQHVSPDSVWDQKEAEKRFDRMMLSLGSRWLTCYAKCDLEQLPTLAEAIRNRMLKLSSQAKETNIFNRGFAVLRDLASTGVKGDELRLTKAVCNLYKSILRRKVHHVNLDASDVHARSKYNEVWLKDGIMLPFLAVLVDRNPCPDERFVKHAKTLKCQGDFYHHLTAEAWDQLKATVETKELLSSLRFLAKTVAAPYTYSTRAKLVREKLEKYVRLLAHIISETIWCDGLGDKGTLLCEVCKTLSDCFDKLSQLDWKTTTDRKKNEPKEGTCLIVSFRVYYMLDTMNEGLDKWAALTQRAWWAAHVIQTGWRRRKRREAKRKWGGLKIVLKVKKSLEMVLRSFYEFTYKARTIFRKLEFGARCKGAEVPEEPLICIVALEEEGPFRGTFAKIKEEKEPPAIRKCDFPDTKFEFDIEQFKPTCQCADREGVSDGSGGVSGGVSGGGSGGGSAPESAGSAPESGSKWECWNCQRWFLRCKFSKATQFVQGHPTFHQTPYTFSLCDHCFTKPSARDEWKSMQLHDHEIITVNDVDNSLESAGSAPESAGSAPESAGSGGGSGSGKRKRKRKRKRGEK